VVFCSKCVNSIIDSLGSRSSPSVESEGQTAQAELRAKHAGNALFVNCDVTNEADIKRLIQVTVTTYGKLDCLINNAVRGMLDPGASHTDGRRAFILLTCRSTILASKTCTRCSTSTSLESSWPASACSGQRAVPVPSSQRVFNRYALPHLRKTQGSIINISSLVGSIGQPGAVTYVASKGAVTALSKVVVFCLLFRLQAQALAIDEAVHNVRVNVVSPGNVWTPMWKVACDERERRNPLNVCFLQAAVDRAADPLQCYKDGMNAQLLARMGTVRRWVDSVV
jgi:NAD(P)-dependent dehydrogenase (short-subunit alcohol dehydrogenase family)